MKTRVVVDGMSHKAAPDSPGRVAASKAFLEQREELETPQEPEATAPLNRRAKPAVRLSELEEIDDLVETPQIRRPQIIRPQHKVRFIINPFPTDDHPMCHIDMMVEDISIEENSICISYGDTFHFEPMSIMKLSLVYKETTYPVAYIGGSFNFPTKSLRGISFVRIKPESETT